MSLPAYTTPKQLNNKAGQGMTDFTQVPNKLITLKIPPAEKAILLVIARFTYGYQRIQCEMSLAQIAEYTDLSRRTVYKLVADLEKKGFLSVVRGKADGINTLNSYQLIDLYSGENISLGREEISLGVGKNLHGGRENISPSKESIKEKDNIPPIVPPSGDVSGSSPASQSHVEPAKTTEPDSKSAEPKPAKAKRTSAELTIEVPVSVNSTAWVEFVQHRKDIKKPLTEKACEKLFKLLAQFDAPTQQAMIDKSIESRWTGIFELKNRANQGFNSSASSWDKPLEITPEFAEHLQARFIAGQKRRGEI